MESPCCESLISSKPLDASVRTWRSVSIPSAFGCIGLFCFVLVVCLSLGVGCWFVRYGSVISCAHFVAGVPCLLDECPAFCDLFPLVCLP